MVEIFDNYNRPKSKAEPGGGVSKTETAGYIPVRIQVENMVRAGQRLGEYRKERYDFDGQVPDDVVPDPTRSPNFDLADATYLGQKAEDSIKADLKRAKDGKAEEAEKKPDEGEVK